MEQTLKTKIQIKIPERLYNEEIDRRFKQFNLKACSNGR